MFQLLLVIAAVVKRADFNIIELCPERLAFLVAAAITIFPEIITVTTVYTAYRSQLDIFHILHRFSDFSLSCGNRITPRIDGWLVSSITRRSMPTPSPPVGGIPYSRASR